MIIYVLFIILLIIFIYKFYITFRLNNYFKKIYESFDNNNNNNNKYKYIIIKHIKNKKLEFVLNNFLKNLSDEWNIVICHGTNNEDFIKDIIKDKLSKYASRIKLINLNVDNLTIKDYNNLLVSDKFYSYIPTEIFLVFQTDTMICPEYKSYINDFLKYDYVGAPWKHLNNTIGNGGLSLRRKSKMLEIIKKCPYNGMLNEDLFFTKECPEIDRYFPKWEDAKHFSTETIYEDKSFGLHQLWQNLDNKIDKKLPFCKGLDTLKKLNDK